MKTWIAMTALTSTLLFTPHAMAGEGGSCHFHGNTPVSEGVVKDCAEQRRASLVKTGKLDASWTAAKQDAIELVAGLSHQKQDGDPPSKPIAVHDCSMDGIRGRDGRCWTDSRSILGR